MERYFEGKPPTDEEISPADRPGRRPGHADSDRLRSGKTGVGLPELLDALAAVRPAADWTCRARRPSDGEEVEVEADPAGPLVAQVFKTRIDPFVQKLSFIRVFSGTLKKDRHVPVVGVRKGVKHGPAASTCRPTRPRRSTRPGPARSWPWPRSKTCTPARSLGEYCHAADHVPHADGRPGRHAQEPRRRGQALRRAAQDRRGRLHLPPRPRRADQGNGHHRHERAAPADHPRAAATPRQGRGGNQGAEDPLSAKRSRPTPRACTATRSRPAAAASSAKSTSACSRCRTAREHRGVRHQGPLPLA